MSDFNSYYDFALGYWQGRTHGWLPDTLDPQISIYHYKMGYAAGVVDYCAHDIDGREDD